MSTNSNYWTCQKALKLCGLRMEKLCGYKLYRYNRTFKYHIIDNKTNKIVAQNLSVKQIYTFLIDHGVIVFEAE